MTKINAGQRTKYALKDSELSQMKKLYLFLSNHLATATMASEATGIPQKNICRYKRKLQKNNKLTVAFRANCKITGFKADYLTCDSLLISKLLKR